MGEDILEMDTERIERFINRYLELVIHVVRHNRNHSRQLNEATYAYINKSEAETPKDDEFDAVSWATIAEAFDQRLQGSLG